MSGIKRNVVSGDPFRFCFEMLYISKSQRPIIPGYHLDGNKEMLAMAFMNIVGSLTSCYAATGALTRTLGTLIAVIRASGFATTAAAVATAIGTVVEPSSPVLSNYALGGGISPVPENGFPSRNIPTSKVKLKEQEGESRKCPKIKLYSDGMEAHKMVHPKVGLIAHVTLEIHGRTPQNSTVQTEAVNGQAVAFQVEDKRTHAHLILEYSRPIFDRASEGAHFGTFPSRTEVPELRVLARAWTSPLEWTLEARKISNQAILPVDFLLKASTTVLAFPGSFTVASDEALPPKHSGLE
ncbi:hypothetical protein HYC85_029249 [Camellia sinensis]|uniref:SLC26A/SulP transporter domain-containing protein n=1 Tax=Camellia sinensis TaxID=4442 RepID=A0A7J7FZV9_CAMSI|nr:hypothetical protein HYC85_029249 [Camellia sinensis]